MLIYYASIPYSSNGLFNSYAIPVLVAIVGIFMVFGITLSWSLRILKIRGMSMYQSLSPGILTLLGTCLINIPLQFVVFVDNGFTLIDWVIVVAVFLVLHPLMTYSIAVWKFRIKWKRAVALSIITVVFDILIIVIGIIICANWIFSEPDA